jgi:ribosome-binding protein aMBF1 (putative translation factor)
MEQELPQSVADEFEALQETIRRKHAPHPPRGELLEEQLQEFLLSLGEDMRRARWRAGFTQQQVAAMMDTTKSSVSRLERLGPSVPTVTTLCRYAHAIECRLQIRFLSRHPEADVPAWLD